MPFLVLRKVPFKIWLANHQVALCKKKFQVKDKQYIGLKLSICQRIQLAMMFNIHRISITVSHVTCHLSCVMCHLSPVTCKKNPIIFFFLFLRKKNLTKWWSKSMKGLLSTGPTLSSLWEERYFPRCCHSILSATYFPIP